MSRNSFWIILLGAAVVALFGLIGWIAQQIPEPIAEPLPTPTVTFAELPPESTPDPCVDLSTGLGGIAVEGWLGRPVTPNPVLADANSVDRQLVGLVYEGLTGLDRSGRPIPALAESWEIAEDGVTVRFQLRDDIRWHDGVPFTANDVAATYQFLQDPAIHATLEDGAVWSQLVITVIDPQQIEFRLSEPYAPFLISTTRGIMPAHLLNGVSAADLATHSINRAPVGTGPFAVQNDWGSDGFVLLTPVRSRWEAAVRLDALQIRFFANEAERLAQFSAGGVHLLNEVDAQTTPDVLVIDGASVVSIQGNAYAQLLFNVGATAAEGEKPVTADRELRLGLAQTIDRGVLVDESLVGQGVPFAGPLPPTSWAYQPSSLASTDLVSATATLDAAGWIRSGENGEGVRIQNEQPLRLSFVALDRPETQAVARQLIRQWQAVGIEVVFEAVPASSWLVTLQNRSYDIALVEYSAPSDPDLYDFWSQEAIVRGQNYASWNNRRASEALEAGRQVWSTAERLDYYIAFQQIFESEVPAVSLYQKVSNRAVNDKISGVDAGPSPMIIDRYSSFPNWRLAEQTADCQVE